MPLQIISLQLTIDEGPTITLTSVSMAIPNMCFAIVFTPYVHVYICMYVFFIISHYFILFHFYILILFL